MLITIDFDNTLFVDNYPQVGRPVPYMVQAIKQLAEDHTLTLWTCREGEPLINALDALDKVFLTDYFTTINEWPQANIDKWGIDCRKVIGDINIDDKNVGCPLITFEGARVVDWDSIMRKLAVC